MRSRLSFKIIGAHILFWLLYVTAEYLTNRVHQRPGAEAELLKSIFLTLPILLVPTYFIALFVVPRYLVTNRWLPFIFWIVATAVLVFFARIRWVELLNFIESGVYYKMPANKLLKNLVRDYAVIALAVCISIIGDYRRAQARNAELFRAKAEAEIKLLKGQLHPHFLFNSLNNIYSLALSRSDQTADSILKLTELLEYLLYRANQDKVLLSKEVELLQHYVELERLRYGDQLHVDSDIAIHQDGLYVAPLILLPFAENCFKHGGAGDDDVFRIKLQLHTDEKKLIFRITNSKRMIGSGTDVNGGIGLNNIRKRLDLLYPGKYTLDIQDDTDSYTVHLAIILRNAEV